MNDKAINLNVELAVLRKSLGLSQSDLAKIIGCDEENVVAIENGEKLTRSMMGRIHMVFNGILHSDEISLEQEEIYQIELFLARLMEKFQATPRDSAIY